MTDSLAAYLSEPCDEPDCDSRATHNVRGRRVCNTHIPPDTDPRAVFARND